MVIYEVKFVIIHEGDQKSLEKEIDLRVPMAEKIIVKKVKSGIRTTKKHDGL